MPATPPQPGKFVLHSNAIPDLPAGEYTVALRQTITAPGATPEALDAHLEVTAPRFALPADQVLSTFPPNKAEGAFSSRLPQIVLRRRTLPWERELDGRQTTSPLPRTIPWLALVVLADAECEYRPAKPVAECVTPGVVLEGRNDTAVGASIVVTDEVVRKAFPTKEELPLLAHVREVDLSDTELALGGDDGWLAVVLSNRLPQPGVRYRACLISLEGQYPELADTAEVEEEFSGAFVYPEAAMNYDVISYQYAGVVDSAASYGGLPPVVPGTGPREAVPGALAETAALEPLGRAQVSTARAKTVGDAWSTAAGMQPSTSTYMQQQYATILGTSKQVGEMHAVGMGVIAPHARQLIFPVLASWQFTCTGAGDFQSLMQGLDVGMLGTPPKPPPPPGPGQKPPPPATRSPAEVLDTGHIALTHTSRDGEPAPVWYRGPLVPRPTSRQQPDQSGRLPLAHASDHLRRVGPDGRENLSLATAFEIGRLLALAEPSVVAALLNWRKEGFEAARRSALADHEPTLSQLGTDDMMAGLASRAGHALLVGLGKDQAARMGPVRPPTDPGIEIEGLHSRDIVQVLSTGLGVAPETVKDLIAPGISQRPTMTVPLGEQIADADRLAEVADRELSPLRGAATEAAANLAVAALRASPAGPAAPSGIHVSGVLTDRVEVADALDRLLDLEPKAGPDTGPGAGPDGGEG
jgi:hypothetical protein